LEREKRINQRAGFIRQVFAGVLFILLTTIDLKVNMDLRKLTLKILPNRLAVCRLDADAPLPGWVDESDFSSITRTEKELTIVCDEVLVASGTTSETGWRCIEVEGPLDFSEIGIVFSLTQPLAESGVAVFLISTFDTDYLMVKEKDLAEAIDVLTNAGHQVKAEDK
jgi:hypothetical protein